MVFKVTIEVVNMMDAAALIGLVAEAEMPGDTLCLMPSCSCFDANVDPPENDGLMVPALKNKVFIPMFCNTL